VRFWRNQRGNSFVYGALGTLLLILAVAALYDVYAAYQYRTWAYEVAGEAARYGTVYGVRGVDAATGELLFDELWAYGGAEGFLQKVTHLKGLTGYTYDIRVITDSEGGTIAGFPPVPRANLDGGYMRLTAPGVGVYLTFAVPTMWLGVLDRDAFQLHVFSAAQASRVP
jgi:hypothetical protein